MDTCFLLTRRKTWQAFQSTQHIVSSLHHTVIFFLYHYDMVLEKELFAMLAIIFTLIGNGVYIASIIKGETKPHLFSFIIWSLIIGIIFIAQLLDGAGVAALATGITGILCAAIAILAYQRRTEIIVSKSDWIVFLAALGSIPLWILTSSPLYSVLLLTAIDLLAFVPTIRKSYHYPFQESLFGHSMVGLQHLLILMALQNVSIITAFYPAAMVCGIGGFIALVVYRRGLILPHSASGQQHLGSI